MDNVTPFPPTANAATNVSKAIKATPFRFIDPWRIPPRDRLYGDHYIRKSSSVTVAPGGVGKSSLVIAEALAMTSKQPLLGVIPKRALRVWYQNNEDGQDELDRRVSAAMLRHNLRPADIGDRLRVTSGRDMEMPIINEEGRVNEWEIVRPIIAELIANQIDVLIVDPLVDCNRSQENDTGVMDRLAKTFGKIAEHANCAVELVHHMRKLNGKEGSVDDARGSVALIAAVRSARVVNVMSDEEAKKYLKGVENPNRLSFVKVAPAKANMSPLSERPSWYRLVSQPLGNGNTECPIGDVVGVVERWIPPKQDDEISDDERRAIIEAVKGRAWRADVRSSEWIGYPVGGALGLDPSNEDDRTRIKTFITKLVRNGVLTAKEVPDEKRRPRQCYVLAGPDLLSSGFAPVQSAPSAVGDD